MRAFSIFALWLGFLVATACASLPEAATPQEAAYLREVEAEPLEFTLPFLELDRAIDRTIDWLVRHEDAPYTRADNEAFKEAIRRTGLGLIQSAPHYRASDLGIHGYTVMIEIEEWVVTVRVTPHHDSWVDQKAGMQRNAKILARYIRTGEEEASLVW